MSCCDNDTGPICPCDTFIHPRVIFNPPGLNAISYRVGDYATFRHALLQARPPETELTRTEGAPIEQIWRPGASGDLAVQMVEWWAYLAHVLTFYNERIANQDYLRTADIPGSVNRLIRLLGYRPRPGIGAVGVLAALANGPKPFTLPKGFQIQSKPGPGQQPQVFELTTDTDVGTLVTGPPTAPQGEMDANPTPDPAQTEIVSDPKDPNYNSVLLAGTSSAVQKNDRVLLALSQSPQPADPFAVATVLNVSHEKDPQFGAVTKIQVDDLSAIEGKDVTTFCLLRSNQAVQVWQYPAADGKVVRTDQANGRADLNAVVRGIKPGDPIVFDGPVVQLVSIVSSTEVVWYANPAGFDPSTQPPYTGVDPSIPPPDSTKTAPFPIPHTSIAFTPQISQISGTNDTLSTRATILIRYGWKEVGNLIAPSPASIGGSSEGSEAAAAGARQAVLLQPVQGSFPTLPPNGQVIVEDANGNGDISKSVTSSEITLEAPVPTLVPPLNVLFNLLSVTRGKSVANEVLGNGNAALAGQEFVLQKAPVTYLQSPESVSGDDYSSTVRVWVNGLEWKEVRSFYGQAADAQVFVTEEDEQGKTHVLFGDGEHGARLPTGVNNVTANYRYGSGAQVPDAGSLTVVLQSQPGLKAIRNPLQVGGGSDPDSSTKVRRLAPQSVLTFNRAVSADDYETIAAQAPGVTRAKAAFAFDATEQRPRVKIWVGDNTAAVTAARSAIAAAADPNRPPAIELAMQIVINLSLTLVLDPRRDSPTVLNAVHNALLDPDNGLLGVNVVEIGQAFYDSQIYKACLAVAGVEAIHDINFSPVVSQIESAAFGNILKFVPAEKLRLPLRTETGLQFRLQQQAGSATQRLTINRFIPRPKFAWSVCQCEHRHDPGDGGYFFLPDDDQHLTLSSTVA
jgi:hypothetical protein